MASPELAQLHELLRWMGQRRAVLHAEELAASGTMPACLFLTLRFGPCSLSRRVPLSDQDAVVPTLLALWATVQNSGLDKVGHEPG